MRNTIIAALFVGCCATPALAQNAEPPVPGNENVAPKLDSKACRDKDRLRSGDTVENEGRAPSTDDSLSERLARTDGVLCPPPGHDPDIRAPAPNTNSDMPVIPPPGSPGGDPAVRPK